MPFPVLPFLAFFLQAAVQEEKRRAYKASQAAEAAVAQERALADKAAAEAQQRMQVRTVVVCRLQPAEAAEGCRWHCLRRVMHMYVMPALTWLLQEAAREHDKAMRQVRAKLQRAEGEARAAKQAVAAAAARVQELEAAAAQKDVQLDSAVQQVGRMCASLTRGCRIVLLWY